MSNPGSLRGRARFALTREAAMDAILEFVFRRIIRRGHIEVETASGRRFAIGDGAGDPVRIKFATEAAQWRLLRDPELAFGELYMEGLATVENGDIRDVLLICADNLKGQDDSFWVKPTRFLRALVRRLTQLNTPGRAARNVQHHYDIDPRLYDLFLDSDRQYSCAYYERPDATLEEAQLAKKRHIAAKLMVEPGQRVLDIGCGWGGLALYLASHAGASVTGVTLSREQLAIARDRARDAGLADRIDFQFQDYRDTPETYDRVVSVGMFEHVGVGFYETYFRKVARALTNDGVALIHTIGKVGPPVVTNPWITKYIFPGGYTPSMSEVLPAIERAGLIVADIEILRLHYAETLKAWRERFMARRAEAVAIHDERFARMWEFYLAGCEAAFRVGDLAIFQFQLCKSVDAVPVTRDYIADNERRLRASDSGAPGLRLAGE